MHREPHPSVAQKVARFLERMRPDPVVSELWDMLPDVVFWVKDDAGRFLVINQALADQAQRPKAMILGKRDVDCFPNELASNYMHDDDQVLKQGIPIRNKPELVLTPEGVVEWRQTTKLPVFSHDGEIIGTAGISRKMDAEVPLPHEYAALTHIVNRISKGLSQKITVRELAEESHFSISTLERYFHSHFGLSPHEFLLKIKVNRAAQLLSNSTLNISEIAAECGYDNVSSFSRAFRRQLGETPGAYRRRHRSVATAVDAD